MLVIKEIIVPEYYHEDVLQGRNYNKLSYCVFIMVMEDFIDHTSSLMNFLAFDDGYYVYAYSCLVSNT